MVGVEVPVDVVIIGCVTACFTECAGVRTPAGIHELYQWCKLNWTITKVRKVTNVAHPQPKYKTPNDIEKSRRVVNRKTSIVMLVGASHCPLQAKKSQYTL